MCNNDHIVILTIKISGFSFITLRVMNEGKN